MKIQKIIEILLFFNLLIVGVLNSSSFSQAQESDSDKVPEPFIVVNHYFNYMEYNELWKLIMTHGEVMTEFGAREITNLGQTCVEYNQDIQYDVGFTRYDNQFTLREILFFIGNRSELSEYTQRQTDLTTCESFDLTYSPIKYNGTIPEFTCNITYNRVHVYPDTFPDSTFDFTLIHNVAANWTNTNIKIEALFDLSNTKFYDGNVTEFNLNEPFIVELRYSISVGPMGSGYNPLIPTNITDTGLEYDIMLESGLPLKVATLNMKNDFLMHNESGNFNLKGYSSIEKFLNIGALVTHGFPNLTYKNTDFIKSDPEIIIYHDRATQKPSLILWILWISIPVGVIGVSIVLLIRKKKRTKNKKSYDSKKTDLSNQI